MNSGFTCGDVCDALLPSFNSCINTFPMTTSSSCLNIVENTTVTRSLCASTYLKQVRISSIHFQLTSN